MFHFTWRDVPALFADWARRNWSWLLLIALVGLWIWRTA